MNWGTKWQSAALGMALAAGLTGCGTPGAPQPPSLNLPQPVNDLSATRVGDVVTLAWTMPKRNTDKLAIKERVLASVCRKEATGQCEPAGTAMQLPPGAAGTLTETLTGALATGDPRTLAYFVELTNRKGRSAGLSNGAVVLAGAAPAPVAGLAVEVRKPGVEVHWKADDEGAAVRLQRKLLTPRPAKKQEGAMAAPAEPLEQNLLIENVASGRALDKSIVFGEKYEYRAQRVARLTVDGKTLELAGELSQPVQVEAKDVFPPDAPTGLAAVATLAQNGGETAIDLSWQPNTETDLAGYVVYRREEDGTWTRISPAEPVVGPAFHDTKVQPGHTYRYAVSALDRGGRESARSDEAQESVPDN